MAEQRAGELFVVATPIGNLEDLSPRARRILSEVDVVAAEDTRHTAKLLGLLGIRAKELVSYHDHIEERRASELVMRLEEEGLQMALVSDAGTPCLADPGYRLVAKARRAGIKVTPVPGPSALTALAASAGLPTDRLLFVGFLPTKQTALRAELTSWLGLRASVVCYETARRLPATLAVMAELMPDAELAVARELTKLYEEVHLFRPAEALSWAENHTHLKGELALMVAPGTPVVDEEAIAAAITAEARVALAGGASHKDLLQQFAGRGLDRKSLYRLLLDLGRG